MVDKTISEQIDSAAKKSSEELFLRGSDNSEVLREKADDEDLKLDDSKEEIFLQNIHRGSEQSESPDQKDGADVTSSGVNVKTDETIKTNYQDEKNTEKFVEDEKIENVLSSDTNAGNNIEGEKSENDLDGDNKGISPSAFNSGDEPIHNVKESSLFNSDEVAQSSSETILDNSEIVAEIFAGENDGKDENFNIAPDAGDDVVIDVSEGESIIEGKLLATDSNIGELLEYEIAEGTNLPDGFLLSEDGTWKFDAQVDTYNHLNEGDVVVLTIPVVVSDERGATDTVQIQITINGTNNAPVAGASVSTDVSEDALTISGQLSSIDVDDGASSTWSVSAGSSVPDGFILNTDGSYAFDSSDGSYDYLNVGDSVTLTIPITVTDENGATDSSQIQITVSGTNDAPIAEASISVNADESTAIINGQFTSSDLDDGAAASWSISAGSNAPDGFVLNSDGSYSFDPADSAYNHLNVGDSEVITIPVTVTDDNGANDTSQIQITISGTNDAPVAGALIVANVDEGSVIITGQLTATDADDGATTTFTITEGNNAPDGFILSADGSYAFDPADSTYDYLSAGDSEVLTIPVTVTDENGATDTTQIEITVSGSNDAPTAIVVTGGAVDENVAGNTVVAQMTTQDVDDGESFTYSITDDPSGLFEVSGDQIVVKDGANIDFETAESHEVSIQVTDANGLTYTQSVTFMVNDVNEEPTNIDLSNSTVDENSVGGTVVATLSTTDEDSVESFSYTLNDDSGLFEISGDQIVVKDGADIDFESAQEHNISVEVIDSAGNSYSEEFTINVNDIVENIAPVAVNDVADSFTPENASLTAEINFDGGVPTALVGSVSSESSGQVGDAADFSSAKVEVSDLALNGDAGAQTTVSMWIKGDPEGGWEMLAASDRYDMVMLNGDIGFNTARGDLFGTDASELADGEWHQIVGVFTNGDVSQNSIYIDGVAQEMSQIRGTPNNNVANIDSSDGSLHFGSWGANNNYRFSGSMDEVKVYDGVLSNDEITQLYEMEADNLSWNGGTLSTQEDTVLTINASELLSNDTDADGDVLTISAVEAGEYGTVELDAEGNVQFTPDENYSGEASFSYTVSDGKGGEDTATVTLNVSSVNDVPTIDVVNTISVNEDGSQQFTYNVSDIDSSDVVLTGESSNGDVVVNGDGTITFTPNENYYGDDTIVLTATDSNGGVSTQNISVTVNPIEDAPDAVNDGIFEPQSATLTAEINFDGGVPTALVGSVSSESSGQVGDAADFSSAKVEVSDLALNGDAGAQTTVSMWIKGDPEGGWEMLAASDRYDMVMLNGDIGFNTARGDLFGTDASELADGEWHQIVGVFTNGDVSQNSIYIDGVAQEMSQIRGTPNNNVANIDSSDGSLHFGSWGANNNYRFSGSMDEVKVYDGALSSDEIGQLHDIESANIKWDSTLLQTDEDAVLVIDPTSLLANDIDVDGDVVTITSVQDAQNGTVEIDADGNIAFIPAENYSGEASFDYTIDDGKGNTDTATVTINVVSDSMEGSANSIVGTTGDDNLTGTSKDDSILGGEGNDILYGGSGDDFLTGGSGNDIAYGEAGNDTYVVNPFDGSDYFSGGEGGSWTDAIDISAVAANDSDNPWTIEVDGAQVEYDLAAGALEMNPDTAGVISFGDGSELSFEGVERIEW